MAAVLLYFGLYCNGFDHFLGFYNLFWDSSKITTSFWNKKNVKKNIFDILHLREKD